MTAPRDPAGADADRDAWLTEALRHAPDAAAAPPAALREAILAEARHAAARDRRTPPARPRAAAPSLGERVLGWWSALARPPVAAGFATVMVAVLVGVMWHDRPLDDAMPAPPPLRDIERAPASPLAVPTLPDATVPESMRPEPTRPDRPAPTMPAAKTAAPTTRPTPAQTPSAAAEAAPATATPKAEAGAFADATLAKRKADVAAARGRVETPREATPPAAVPTDAARPFPGSDATPSTRAPARADDRATATLAEQQPVVGEAARRESEGAAAGGRTAADRRASQEARSLGAAEPGVKAATDKSPLEPPAAAAVAPPAPALRQRATPSPSGSVATESSVEAKEAAGLLRGSAGAANRDERAAERPRLARAPTAEPLATLRRSLADPAARWTHRSPARGDAAIDAALLDWLARLDAATVGRWQRRAAAPPPVEGAATTLELLRDGGLAATIRVDDAGVFYRAADGDAWFAPLDAGAAARLRAPAPGGR